MAKLKVDGKEIEVPDHFTLLQACEEAGAEVPRFCFHERLSVAGNCRMCLIEVKGGPPKPAASCAMGVRDIRGGPNGELPEVFTNTPMVKKAREGVMEFLLINHPLDCPICDQGGECDLQDQAMAFGIDSSRYTENKRAVEDKYIGPLVKTVMNRCIHCTRCVRFTTEVGGISELGLIGRGEDAEITTYLEHAMTSELQGNVIDLCPVGALTSRPFAFTARPWELGKTESIDVMDAVGSAIRVDTRGREVMRIMPRVNEQVNEEWISDKTRFIWGGLKTQRLDRPYVRRDGRLQPATWAEAFGAIRSAVSASTGDKIGAIAGDLASVEEMYALKLLMQSLGSQNLDCRQDGTALDPSLGRSSYIFNPTIEGIEQAGALLLIGANPRLEAAVLNARIRKRFRRGNFPIGVIGEVNELRYDYDYLGAGPETLSGLASGANSFAEKLRGAKNPMIIVGQGALSRPDGLAVLQAAAQLAGSVGALTEDWNGFAVLHTAASRVGGLDLGFVPGPKGANAATMLRSMDVLFLLGADEMEFSTKYAKCTVYIGSHGDAGAMNADVILPGAAYTEKSGTWVNTEGRVQTGARAGFAPGEAREEWAILRALSDVLGKKLPFDSLSALRAKLYQDYPHFAAIDEIAHGSVNDIAMLGQKAGDMSKSGFASPIKDFYLTNPIARASAVMAECSALARNNFQVAAENMTMDSFFSTYVWPALIMIGQSLLLLVCLLVFIAYILLADRKIWAAVQLRRGPNVVGPFGLFQSFADLLKFVFKEPIIPAGANKGVFLLAPLVSVTLALATWAVVPLNENWAIANINVGILYVFAISSLEVYGIIMSGWASNSKYAFLGSLRSAAQMVSYEVSIGFVIVTVLLCVGSLNLSDMVFAQKDGLGTTLGLPASFLDWHFIPLFPMFVVFFISGLAETNRPPFDLPEAESELVAGYMVEYSSAPYMMLMLGEYAAILLVCSLTTILFLGGWLPPLDVPVLNWVPGIIWFVLKVLLIFFGYSMVKAFVPRYRYDQLMRLGWKIFLPLSLVMVIVVAFVLKLTGWA